MTCFSNLFRNWFCRQVYEKFDISRGATTYFESENQTNDSILSGAFIQSGVARIYIDVWVKERTVNHLLYLKWHLSRANAYSASPGHSKRGNAVVAHCEIKCTRPLNFPKTVLLWKNTTNQQSVSVKLAHYCFNKNPCFTLKHIH